MFKVFYKQILEILKHILKTFKDYFKVLFYYFFIINLIEIINVINLVILGLFWKVWTFESLCCYIRIVKIIEFRINFIILRILRE